MPFSVRPAKFSAGRSYDLFLCALGFEDRSTFILRSGIDAERRAAFPFNSMRVGAFRNNLQVARAVGAEVHESESDDRFRALMANLLASATRAHESATIAVDISSFTRVRLAHIVKALEVASGSTRIEVDFLYAPARFSPPPTTVEGMLEAGPVTPEFRGSMRRVSIPLTAVIGLGYEPQRALGAFELLEPADTWAFLPSSDNRRYDESLQTANSSLLDLIPDGQVLTYNVRDAADTYYRLESFVFTMKTHNRLALVPMGPKIFALCCLLIGANHEAARPAVWRIGERAQSVHESEADGHIVALRATISSDVGAMSL